MKIGYALCNDRNDCEWLEARLRRMSVDRIYIDCCETERDEQRALRSMLEYVREGDVIMIESLSRLSSTFSGLLAIVNELTEKKAELFSQAESCEEWQLNNKTILPVLRALCELEDSGMTTNIQPRQLSRSVSAPVINPGISAERRERGREPIKVDQEQFEAQYKLWRSGQITARAAMSKLMLKPNTFYRRVKEYETAVAELPARARSNS